MFSSTSSGYPLGSSSTINRLTSTQINPTNRPNQPIYPHSSTPSQWRQNYRAPLDEKEKAIIPFLWGYALISVLLSLSIWRNFYNIAVDKKKSTLSVGKFRLVLSIIILIISPIITGVYTFTQRRLFKFPLYIYFTIAFLIQFVIIATI